MTGNGKCRVCVDACIVSPPSPAPPPPSPLPLPLPPPPPCLDRAHDFVQPITCARCDHICSFEGLQSGIKTWLQVAANNRGILLVRDLIQEYSLEVVQAYMTFIQVTPKTHPSATNDPTRSRASAPTGSLPSVT